MRIVHFKIRESTFILRDQELLERHFKTRNYRINTASRVAYFFALIKLLFFLLFTGWRYDAFYIRFADWHTALIALFKRLYRKKLYIVVGGYDVAAIRRFNYGAHRNSIQSRFIRYSLNHATCLFPNSDSMVYYENRFIQDEPIYGGIKYFAPETRARIIVVHNGFDSLRFKMQPETVKREMAITVAVVNQEKTYYMKGLDRYIQTARALPGYGFLIVGISNGLLSRLEPDLPANLKTMPPVSTEELIRLYSESKVFCLFSLSEGMPNTLCEAMLCECIPVGTEVTSIPEIIGDTGFIVHSPEPSEFVDKVKMAFHADPRLGLSARQRIASMYSPGMREEKIISILSDS